MIRWNDLPGTAARFGGLGAAGLALSSVVVGHASAGVFGPVGVLFGLLLVALAVHVVAYALRNLFDPAPAGPLAPPVAAVAIAGTAVASFIIDGLFFGIAPPRGLISGTVALAAAYVALVGSVASRPRVPARFAVALAGVGWGCLVYYGAARGGGATAGTFLAALYVLGYTVLADGSLRWPLTVALAGLALVSPFGGPGGFGWWFVWYVVALLAAALMLAVRRLSQHSGHPDLDRASVLVAWLPLVAMTAMYGGLWQAFVALVALLAPALTDVDNRRAIRSLPAAFRSLPATLRSLPATVRSFRDRP